MNETITETEPNETSNTEPPPPDPLTVATERREQLGRRLEQYRGHVEYIRSTGANTWVETEELERIERAYQAAVDHECELRTAAAAAEAVIDGGPEAA